MDAVRLKIGYNEDVMASIICDGNHGGHADYYSVVSVNGFIENKKIYGVDPLQSFVLGWRLIEELTDEQRLREEGPDGCDGASWQIESF